MNIAYVLNSITGYGGLQRIIIDKANELCRVPGINVFIFCMNTPKDSVPAFEIDDRIHTESKTTYFEPENTTFRRNPVLFGVKLLKWRKERRRIVKEFIKSHQIDVVIYSTYNAYFLPVHPGCKMILESHTERASTAFFKKRKFMRRLRAADVLVALTDADRAQWLEARNCVTIPNFTTITPLAPYNPDTRRVMAAGRLDPQKGFDILVKAWRHVARTHPDWVLDIYYVPFCLGFEMADLLSQINEAGLSHCVNLREATNDIASALSEHSLFVLSSRYEGFGLVLIEAMTCGVPCVSFDCPEGPSEIIKDGEDGWLVPFRGLSDDERADALGNALCDAIADRDARLRFSEAGLKSVKRFSPDAVIPQWMDLFNSLIKNK